MFNYLFYRIFRFQNRIIGEEGSSAAFSAFLSIAMFWGINLGAVFIIIDKKRNLLSLLGVIDGEFNILIPGVTFVVIGIISFLCFYQKSKYVKIIDKIENDSLTFKKKYNFWSILYQILSLILIIGAIIYRFN